MAPNYSKAVNEHFKPLMPVRIKVLANLCNYTKLSRKDVVRVLFGEVAGYL